MSLRLSLGLRLGSTGALDGVIGGATSIAIGALTAVGAAAVPVVGIANGDYGEFTVAAGEISPRVSPLTPGTFSIGDVDIVTTANIAHAKAGTTEVDAAVQALALSGGYVLTRDKADYTGIVTEITAKAFTGLCIVEPENWTDNADPRLVTTSTKSPRIELFPGCENITVRGFDLYHDQTDGSTEAFDGVIRIDRPSVNITVEKCLISSRSMDAIHTAGDFTSYGAMNQLRGITASEGTGSHERIRIMDNYIHDCTRCLYLTDAITDGTDRALVSGNYLENAYNNFCTFGGATNGLNIFDNYAMHVWLTTSDFGEHSSIGFSFDTPTSGQFQNCALRGNRAHIGWRRKKLDPGQTNGATGVKFNNPNQTDSYAGIEVGHNLFVTHGLSLEMAGCDGFTCFNNTIVDESYTGSTSSAVLSLEGCANAKLYNNIAGGYGLGAYDGAGEKGRQVVTYTGLSGTIERTTSPVTTVTFTPSGLTGTIFADPISNTVEVQLDTDTLGIVPDGETLTTSTGATATTSGAGVWFVALVNSLSTLQSYGNIQALPSNDAAIGDYSAETIFAGHSVRGFDELLIDDLEEAYTPIAGQYALTATQKKGAIGTGYYTVGGTSTAPAFAASPTPTVATGYAGDLTSWASAAHARMIAALQSGGSAAPSSKQITFGWSGSFADGTDGDTVGLFAANVSRILVSRITTNKLRVSAKNAAGDTILQATSENSYGVAEGHVRPVFSVDLSEGIVQIASNGVVEKIHALIENLEDDTIDIAGAAVWYINSNASGSEEFEGNFEQAFFLPEFIDLETQTGLDKIYAADGQFLDFTANGSTINGSAIPIMYRGNAAGIANGGDGGAFSIQDGPIVDVGGAQTDLLDTVGDFSDAADWSLGAGITVSGGQLLFNTSGNFLGAKLLGGNRAAATAGDVVTIEIDVDSITTNARFRIGLRPYDSGGAALAGETYPFDTNSDGALTTGVTTKVDCYTVPASTATLAVNLEGVLNPAEYVFNQVKLLVD